MGVLGKPSPVPTVLAKSKATGKVMLVNVDGFNEELFEKVDAKDAPVATKTPPTATKEDVDAARGDLAGMSVDNLKALPEWADVPDKASLRNKDAIVDAILAVRFPGQS